MDFKAFSQNFSDKIGGKYNDYDDHHSIFIIPIKNDRFQTVIARVVKLEKYNYDVVHITSKVCETSEKIDYPTVLEASADFALSNFIVEDGFLKVDASILLNSANEELIGDTIVELATLADEWELKITGKDIY
ncbi:MAG: hypothetical protein CMB80_19250 [Flammeovirgaceae bacterium]|nr:hypothetical protein [Flammeovirgaceae bacterium]MBR07784.1 hypothetical protein [Rickettsiales bacterium]|tara:strand:- start:1775 stop:2173 length:399 start_codon:yes stop_codon:yes gene_type:complete